MATCFNSSPIIIRPTKMSKKRLVVRITRCYWSDDDTRLVEVRSHFWGTKTLMLC